MKIAFIGGRDVRNIGGIENYMLNLASKLVELGHEPLVFCESDRNEEKIINGFRAVFVKGPSSPFLCKPFVGLKATFRVIFREKDVDLIHYNAWPPSIWSPLARLAGIPSLMEGHGLEWQRSKYSHFHQKVLKLMEAYTARINRHLIMCSEAQVRYFKEKYNKDSVCIPTAINLSGPSIDSSILSKYSLEKKKFYLFMGRLVQDKNPDILIRAFKKNMPEGYKLVVAGDNAAMPQYVSYLHELANGENNIVFTGAVYGEDKETLLNNAFCFCLPSTIEGLSIALLEAMGHKLSVIASDIEANREVLGPDSAFWVRPENEEDLANALEKASRDAGSAASVIEENYKRVSDRYTWDKVAAAYIETVKNYI